MATCLALLATGTVVLFSAPRRGLEAQNANFIRPGYVIKITGASIAADGTIKANVTLTDGKTPLDRDGILTAGTIGCSLVCAVIPKNATQYTSYTTRVQTSPITGKAATQAGADSGGVWTKVADGQYTYTFATKAPASIDRSATHTIAAYGSRNLTEFDLGTQYSDATFNFVPNGGAVTQVRDVIRSVTCNKCHSQMAFHGGSRRSHEVCVVCHQPQSVDPDTGNTVDMPVMIHKIHMGSSLPSVKAGKPYKIIGNAQSVNDYSDVAFPADARQCTVCHEQNTGATQANAYLKGNRAACGACHDNVDFATGLTHANLPQLSDNLCTTCHIPRGEIDFDISIAGAHAIPQKSVMLPGVVAKILAVDGADPGKTPTVTFSLKDKSGKILKPSDLTSLSLYLVGPNTDYLTANRVSNSVLTAQGPGDGRYYWTFTTPLPADARGSWTFTMEGRKDVTLLPGTVKQQVVRDILQNQQFYFSVDGSKVQARRVVVSTDKCNSCHAGNFYGFHGGSRNESQECGACHNATYNSGSGAAAFSINFPALVHKIHGAEMLTRPFKVGSSDFSGVGYPGNLRDCNQCHVNNSQQLPIAAVAQVVDPSGYIPLMGPTTAACLSCHDTKDAASHALSNVNAVGESCAACHGPDGDFSVDKVHAH